MEEREYLASTAMMPQPMVKDGRMKPFQVSRPPEGSHPSCTEKIWMPIRPSQKPGADRPVMASSMQMWSSSLPCLMAEMTPIKMPSAGAQMTPANTSLSVCGILSAISSVTGVSDFMLRPMSPWNSFTI